jgi:hypothetical protein
MESDLILYLENPSGDIYQIPIFDGYNVSLSLSFTDLQNFRPTGLYSNTFRCPLDYDLQQFIGDVGNPNYSGWYSSKDKIPAYITVDTIPYSRGSVELTNTFLVNGMYEVEFRYFGETPDIKATLGESKLKDLTDLPNLNHTIDYAAITNDALLSGNVLYYLIDRGQNFSQGGEAGTRPIFTPLQPLVAADLTPSVNARYLWDEIWSDSGFVVESPSSFPDTLDSLWIPWYAGTLTPIGAQVPNAENFRLNLLTADAITYGVGIATSDVTTMTEQYDENGNVTANVFTAPFSGTFRFRAWANLLGTDSGGINTNNAICRIILRDSSNNILSQSPSIFVAYQEQNGWIHYAELEMNSGDTLKMSIYHSANLNSCDAQLLGTAATDHENGSGLELYEVTVQNSGYEVDMMLNAPDMKQYDFLTSILRMFNAVVIPDNSVPKKLRIESMNDYLQSGNTIDWTDKLDLSKDIAIKPTTAIQSRDLKFTYKSDGDALNKIYTDEAGRVFGTLDTKNSQILINLQSDFASGQNTVQLAFAPTPCNNIIGTNIPIPKFINGQGGTFKAAPRILYHAFDADNVQIVDDDTATVTATTVRVLSHFDNYDIANEEPGADTFDLNFAPEVYLQETVGAPFKNLFYLYWQDYIREIYDPSARIMEAHFALTINDFLAFDFSDLIWIKDSYWRVLDVSDYGVGMSTPTKITLLKILTADLDCGWTPYQSNANGTMDFINADGVTTGAGTQTCCEFFGYTWASARCYWNTPTGGFAPNGGGLKNFGAGSSNTKALPRDSISYVSASNISAGNFGAKFGGLSITSGQGNTGAIMHGQNLTASDNIGSFAAFGNNAAVEQAGIHFGGGVLIDGTVMTSGRAQFGSLVSFGSGVLVNVSDSFELFLNANDRLVIPDDTCWSLRCSVSVIHFNTSLGYTDKNQQLDFILEIHKSNGVAGVTSAQISPNHEDGNLSAHLDLGIDVTTDTTQHRFSIICSSAAGLPSGAIEATMKIEYVQTKH